MPEQLEFTGFGAAERPTDRVFLALFPDVDVAMHMARTSRHLCVEHGLKGKPLATERFHVTLHHLGDYVGLPRDVVAAAGEAAATVAFPPFDIVFDRAVSFIGRSRSRPFVLRGGDGVATLITFQKALGLAITKAGLGRWVTPHYTPHVTLLYDDRRLPEQTVETIGWTAQEFVLVHSLLGRTRHVPLARWQLRG
jgi:2'-5' RNA ligase